MAEVTDQFGPAALRLAGFCGVHLGWSPGQFWAATPAEVVAVVAALLPARGDAPVTRGELMAMEDGHG